MVSDHTLLCVCGKNGDKVGAVYNNMVDNESIDNLMARCEKIRLLDEKHAEAKFIEGKVKVFETQETASN